MLYNLITLPAESISKGIGEHNGTPAYFLEGLCCSFVFVGTLGEKLTICRVFELPHYENSINVIYYVFEVPLYENPYELLRFDMSILQEP